MIGSERGSASVVVVAIVAATVSMCLATADLARVLVRAAEAQTAADAAALAAAQELAIPGGRPPPEVAAEYAGANGGSLESCLCAVGTFEAVVGVRVPVGDLLMFGGGRTVFARARAVVDLEPT